MKYPFMIIHDRNYNLIQNEEDLINVSFDILKFENYKYQDNWLSEYDSLDKVAARYGVDNFDQLRTIEKLHNSSAVVPKFKIKVLEREVAENKVYNENIKKAQKVLDGSLPKHYAWRIIKERADIEVVYFDNIDYDKIINV